MDDAFELEPLREKVGETIAQRNFSVGFLKGNSLSFKKNVIILPYAIETLVDNHIPVFVQRDLGCETDFTNLDYADCGADIIDNPLEICKQADILVSLAPFSNEEISSMKKHQIIISPFKDIDATEDVLKELMAKGITALSLNFIKNEKGIEHLKGILADKENPLAVSASLGDFVLSLIFPFIFNSNIRHAVQTNPTLLKAIYCYKGILTNSKIAERLSLPSKDILMLCWDMN